MSMNGSPKLESCSSEARASFDRAPTSTAPKARGDAGGPSLMPSVRAPRRLGGIWSDIQNMDSPPFERERGENHEHDQQRQHEHEPRPLHHDHGIVRGVATFTSQP